MFNKALLIAVLFLIILSASIIPAGALLGPGLGGLDMTVSNPANPFPDKYYWTGTRAYYQVDGGPPTTARGSHLNSIYMKQESRNFTIINEFEFGWYWDLARNEPAAPHYFVVVYQNGLPVTFDDKDWKDLGYAAPGTTHLFRIQVDQNRAYFNLDNSSPSNLFDFSANFPSGLSLFGSERRNNGDNGYSHFWSLQKRNAAWAYGNWQNLQTYNDDDAGYGVQKISGSNTNVQTVSFAYQPFYRLWNGRNHFYTMDQALRWSLLYPDSGNFTYEGTCCEMANGGDYGAGPFYRSYNRSTGDHLYTASHYEATHSPGYEYEGIIANIYLTQVSGSIPLYRFYKASTGDHFYSISEAEGLNAGYSKDGPAGYVMILF